ncbi:cobalamin B12-binding domain-containing protein [[Mycobacterium] manitobense]|uniref:cobalamin B12-binding domain-containing protein n=1 Tax=[Mycobacterium] manitobense TaxID=190147 RepID=UPI0021F292ED|nr:cobalamin-dependent protein [[Mycobacterium] manitobense]
MNTAVLTDALNGYEDALSANDAVAATTLVTRLLANGADPVAVLTDVVATAQRTVGSRWQRGEWTVAEEHAATAIAVAATTAVAGHVRQVPVTRGRVLVACAEREWHALPAMIIACALRANGWDSTLLGAATTPLRLSQHLQDLGPDAIAVSCSVLASLPTTRRFMEAGTGAGVPVVVGGPAFGYDDVRATALGATAWAPDAHGAVAVLAGLPAVVPPATPLPADAVAEQSALDLDHRRLVAMLRDRWSPTREVGVDSRVLEVAGDALHQALHAVAAALLTADPRPVAETSAWIAELLRTRGADATAITELGTLMTSALRDYPLAGRLVAEHFTGDWPDL